MSDTLDAAYELVGIIDEAQRIIAPDIAKEATTTLNIVIERATQSAITSSMADAHDTLDQLVDISFFARNSFVTGADTALQKSLRTLFPKITSDVRTALAISTTSADRWPVALANLSVLGELQAAATLMMLDDLAGDIDSAFGAEAARLETLAQQSADPESQARLLDDLTAARKSRDEQLIDAKANDLKSVAAEMGRADPANARGQESTAAAGFVEIDNTCIETGVLDDDGNMYATQDQRVQLEEQCVLTGRLPSEARCPTREIVFVCRDVLNPTTERITYTYRGTPEAETARERCNGDVLPVVQMPGATPAFKNPAMRRIMSCLPVSNSDLQ